MFYRPKLQMLSLLGDFRLNLIQSTSSNTLQDTTKLFSEKMRAAINSVNELISFD